MLSQVYFAEIACTQQPYFFELSSATTCTCQTLATGKHTQGTPQQCLEAVGQLPYDGLICYALMALPIS